MLKVAFIGRAGSGKDTFADILAKNENLKKLSFAKAIKDILSEMLKIDRACFDDQEQKVKPIFKGYTPRELMQWFGSVAKDQFGERFWVERLEKEIEQLSEGIVISDVRFPKEAEMLHRRGFTLVYLNRDHVLGPLPFNAHASEKLVYETAKFAKNELRNLIEIENKNTLEHYKKNLSFMIKKDKN